MRLSRGKGRVRCAKTPKRCGSPDPCTTHLGPYNHIPNKQHHHAMTNLDVLLLKGSTSDNPEERLRELRYEILTNGIPANSEGMVPNCPRPLHTALTDNCLVRTAHLHLAHLPQRAAAPHRRLPRPNPPRRLARTLQNHK
jgi:hypothetical protein